MSIYLWDTIPRTGHFSLEQHSEHNKEQLHSGVHPTMQITPQVPSVLKNHPTM